MKPISFLLLVALTVLLSSGGQAKTKAKPVSAKHSPHKSISHPATTRKIAAKKQRAGKSQARTVHASSTAGRRGRGKHGRVSTAPPVATWRRGQMEPSPDRYREIQQALASKGYLKAEPTGNWDGDSQEALRRFQADQRLEQSGKVTAKSLIALGLGPSKSSDLQNGAAVPIPTQNK